MKKITIIIVSIILAFFAKGTSNAQTPIMFEKGKSEKTISLTLPSGKEKTYSVAVNKGQVINLGLSGDIKVADDNEFPVISLNLLNGENEIDDWQDGEGYLSILTGRKGNYIFKVSNSDRYRSRTFAMDLKITSNKSDYLGGVLAGPKTIRDYYLAIPTDYIKADAKKRAGWIESEFTEGGNLTFDIPVKELTGEDGDGKVFGSAQLFPIKGGMMIGVATNMCESGKCVGQVLFLEYKDEEWTEVTSDVAPQPDNDEVISVLREAPAFEDKDSLKDGVEVPLQIDLGGGEDKVIQFIAGGKNGDGGVLALMFKWNGTTFTEFHYPEGLEE